MRTMWWGAACAALVLACGCGTDSEGDGPPRIASFTVSPTTVVRGGAVLIGWEATGARTIRVEACEGFNAADESDWCVGGAVHAVAIDDPTQGTGFVVTNVLLDTRFRLAVAGDGDNGTTSLHETVTVQEAPTGAVEVREFRAEPREVAPGETAMLRVDVRGAAQVDVCDATAAPGYPGTWTVLATVDADPGTGIAFHEREVTPMSSRLYGLRETGSETPLAFAILSVRSSVPTIPYVMEFTADPLEVDEGDDVTLTWATRNATALDINPEVSGFTGTDASGSLSFAPPFLGTSGARTSSTVYVLTASNGEYSDTASVVIAVRGAPLVNAFTASPETIAPGTDVTLTWDTSRADEVVITADPADATLPATFAVDGTATVNPTATTTYTLTATGITATPVTATATVTIGTGAVVDSFTATPNAVAVGGTAVTLTWTTTDADTVDISAVPADSTLPATFAVDGTATVNPAEPTVYTLTATGAVGSPATATASVMVVAPGDLVITEIMFDPAGVADTAGEWFEVTNVAGHDIPAVGFTLGDGSASHVVAGTVSVADADWFVFGINDDTATNGGVTVGYEYTTLDLVDPVTVALTFDGVTIDTVTYDAAASFPEGYSISLDPAHISAVDNDTAANWCQSLAADSYGSDGNYGTPGASNNCT